MPRVTGSTKDRNFRLILRGQNVSFFFVRPR
jgi:hypothetical protein